MIRLGLLGLGVAGNRHLRGLRGLSRQDVCLTAIADGDTAAAATAAAEFGAQVYADYKDLLREAAVDAVIVALPHFLHKDAAVMAANRGLHVLMDKPIANSMADAERILMACDEANVRLMLGYVHRFREEILVARRMLLGGEIGQPASIFDRFCVPGNEDLPAWVWDRDKSGGGVMMYSGLHAIDRLRWLLNSEVVEVYARVQSYGKASEETNIENGVSAILTFNNGVIATLAQNLPPYELNYRYWDTEIFGTRGLLHIRNDEYLEFTGPHASFRQTFTGYNHYARQIAEFADAIHQNRAPSITGEDGLRSLAVGLAVYRSAYVGRSVLVSDRD
jgi:predicted dehydrogenase